MNESYPVLFKFLLNQQMSLNLSIDVRVPDTFEECMRQDEIVKFLIQNVFERKLQDQQSPLEQLREITQASTSEDLLGKILKQLIESPLFEDSSSTNGEQGEENHM